MYTKIKNRFWQDEKMQAMSCDARYLMLYLLTSPHRNIICLYFLPAPYACFDLGWEMDKFKKVMQELITAGLIKHDTKSNVVLVKNYLKHNPLENQNQVTSAIKMLDQLPDTELFADLLEVLKECEKSYITPLTERLAERLPEPFQNPLGNPSETVPATSNSIQEQYTGTGLKHICASEHDKTDSAPAEKPATGGAQRKAGKGNEELDRLFDLFWSAYPKRRSKGQAKKTWEKLNPDEQLVAKMVATIERAKKSVEWQKENGQFIPYPSSWLNAQGWEDEYTVTTEKGVGDKYANIGDARPEDFL